MTPWGKAYLPQRNFFTYTWEYTHKIAVTYCQKKKKKGEGWVENDLNVC